MSLLCIICPKCGGTAFLPKDEFPGEIGAVLAYHIAHPMVIPPHLPAPEGAEYTLCHYNDLCRCAGSGTTAWLGVFKPKPKK